MFTVKNTSSFSLLATLLCFCINIQAEINPPQGAVVITIIGDVGVTNRPPFDANHDYFFQKHKLRFQQAVAFDYPMLEALGMQKIRIGYHGWPQPQEVEGPTLKALLATVGITDPELVTLTALDGYKVALDQELLSAHDWILAIKREGRYLSLGQLGPTWLVNTPASDDGLATKQEAALWPWGNFVIEIKK